MKIFYQFGTSLYFIIVRIATLWNPKAKLFVQGRKELWTKLKRFKSEGKEVFWFHCASLGEFEQARPLIERLKKDTVLRLKKTQFFGKKSS